MCKYINWMTLIWYILRDWELGDCSSSNLCSGLLFFLRCGLFQCFWEFNIVPIKIAAIWGFPILVKNINEVLIIFFRWRFVDKPLCSAWTKQPLRKRHRETSLSIAAWREGRNKGPTGEARSSCSWHVEGNPALSCLGEVISTPCVRISNV